ncbi:hypothetical protein ABWH97_00015 [Nitratireductor sp. ac15]
MTTKAKKKSEAKVETAIVAYKGFNKDMTCRGFQYEVGKTYDNGGKEVIRCGEGAFHWVEMPLDVFSYYGPAISRYAEVVPDGQIVRPPDEDTKGASSILSVKVDISIGDLTRKAVAWVAEKAKAQGTGQFAAGDCGHASAAGDCGHASAAGSGGHASAAGYRGHASAAGSGGHASAAGDCGHASAAGSGGHASAAGDCGHASAAGSGGHASAAGDCGHASAAGYYGHASAAGSGGHASAAGYRGHASAAGDCGHASAAGSGGHASAAGYRGHASAAGYYGHASVKGKNAVAHAPGIRGSATAHEGGAISLAAYDDAFNLVAVRSSLVGQNGIEAGKTYRLTTAGEFEEI